MGRGDEMSKFAWLSLAALVVLAAGGGIASSASNPDAPNGQVRVYGGGRAGPPPNCSEPDCTRQTRDFSLDVHGTLAGQSLVGDLADSRPAGPVDAADITCVTVDGDKAAIGGIVRSGASPLVGDAFVLYVVDNGPPSSPTDDLYSRPFFLDPEPFPGQPADFPKTCPASAESFFGYLSVNGGDIVVEDAK
jgi:hypothetical protein